jgi:hypothetical protein
MGSFEIEFLQEGVERGLLLQEVDAGRAASFLGQMHAFMTAVLLGMAGTDPLNRDSYRNHQNRELRES